MGTLRETDDKLSLGVEIDYKCPSCGAICLIDSREGFEWKFCPIEGKEVKLNDDLRRVCSQAQNSETGQGR
jgi:transposase